ncbi:putative immune-type receptor 4a isoform 2 precursor, partial [Silurus meridionalis]
MFYCAFFIFFFTAGSFADKIGPKDEDVNGKETDTVTLKCSYDSSSDYIFLYWYKQYPNNKPQFLLYKGARSRSDRKSTPDDPRLVTITTRYSTELTIRDLKISDSALYHCALRVDAHVWFAKATTLFIYFNNCIFTAGISADKIGPAVKDVNIIMKETDTVTLKCSYETNSDYIDLYWYKQYPNSTPQFLLYKGARSRSSKETTPDDHRLESETSRDSTKLIIRGLKLTDSALYHCALQ